MRSALAILAFAVALGLACAAKRGPSAPHATESIGAQLAALGAGDPASERATVLISPDDPVVGPPDALVTIVEFLDFQCPSSRRAADAVRRIVAAYPRDVRIVFKQRPLPSHNLAFGAAEAALAAAEQGKFLEMHDRLFAGPPALDRAALAGHAAAIALDRARFDAALASHRFEAKVRADSAYGDSLGVAVSPTFFVNGKLVKGAVPLALLRATVDEQVAHARKLMAERRIAAGAVYRELMRTARRGAPPAKVVPPVAPAPPPKAGDSGAVYLVEVSPRDPQLGPATAKVTIVEFCDLTGAACVAAARELREIMRRHPEDVRLVFRSLPLRASGTLPAEVAMAAHAQGRFWPMHDRILERVEARDRASLGRMAQELGLDVARIEEGLTSRRFRGLLARDAQLANQLGVQAPPAFFVNGRRYIGPVAGLEPRVREELERAEALLARGIKPGDLYATMIKDGVADVQAAPTAPRYLEKEVFEVEVGRSPALGRPGAPVTIIEFFDFQCPYCARVAATTRKVHERHPDRVRVVFKNLPLLFHPDAALAAEAALAAHAQGKFWPMHDVLFANQGALDRVALERYAREVGLDLRRFRADLDGRRHRVAVQADTIAAKEADITGTPTFLINGHKVQGVITVEQFERLMTDAELAPR